MTPSPKKWSCPSTIFSPFSSKILLFLEKFFNLKIFNTSFPIKKGCVHFRRRSSSSFQKRWALETVVLSFTQKIQPFLKKLLNNKVFSTSFVIKKSYVNFWCKMPHFPKKLTKVPPKQFCTVNFQKIDKNR